ncbi:hypothetical protein Tco_0932633 [Tanacetum coccineum]
MIRLIVNFLEKGSLISSSFMCLDVLCLFIIKDHLGKFDAKADDGYLGHSFVFKAFRVYSTRRQQIEETCHVTIDKSDYSKEQNTPHTEDVKGPPDLINTEGMQVQEVQNELINNQPTEEPLGNNIKTSVSITKLSVPKVVQSQITHHASTSSHPAPQDRWSRDKHIKPVKNIGKPTEGMLTRSMAAKLTPVSASECLFVDFLFKIEPKKVFVVLKQPRWVDAMQEE